MRKWLGLPYLTLVVAAHASAQGPTPKAIPDEPSCPRCTISTRTLVTFGTEDGVGSLNGKPMSVNVDSRGRYWLFLELEPPTVFSANGTVDRMIGRKGSGPGEFQSANYGIAVGDSMLVFDWLSSRATMVGPDLKPGRSIRIFQGMGDLVTVEWPSVIVMHGHVASSKPPNSTMHRLSLTGPEVRVLGSFGPQGTGGPMGNVDVDQQVGWGRNGVWSAYWKRPLFTRWDRAGVMQQAFTRRFDWFTGEESLSLGNQNTPPSPRAGLITEDSEGLVWYFIYRAASTWKEGWAGVKPFQGHEYRVRDVGYDKLFTTYVEVIEPSAGPCGCSPHDQRICVPGTAGSPGRAVPGGLATEFRKCRSSSSH